MQADRNEVSRIEKEMREFEARDLTDRIKEMKRQRIERIGIVLFFALPVLLILLE